MWERGDDWHHWQKRLGKINLVTVDLWNANTNHWKNRKQRAGSQPCWSWDRVSTPECSGREKHFPQRGNPGIEPGAKYEGRFDDIAGFADIGDFIEQPVKFIPAV